MITNSSSFKEIFQKVHIIYKISLIDCRNQNDLINNWPDIRIFLTPDKCYKNKF